MNTKNEEHLPGVVPDVMVALRRPFPAKTCSLKDKYWYVSWQAVHARIQEQLGVDWDWSVKAENVQPVKIGRKQGEPVDGWMATVCGTLSLRMNNEEGPIFAVEAARDGVDAHVDTDPGNALKAAMSGALVKAASMYGIGAELQDPARRAELTMLREVMGYRDGRTVDGWSVSRCKAWLWERMAACAVADGLLSQPVARENITDAQKVAVIEHFLQVQNLGSAALADVQALRNTIVHVVDSARGVAV